VSPRRNRPRTTGARSRATEAAPLDLQRALRGVDAIQTWPDGQWRVRTITGEGVTKTYRCPGCDHEIRPGVPHLVAWPCDGRGDLSDRRHWHSGCWRARDRRAPVVQRSRNAPRYG